jgi:hypothetical protein
MKFEDQIRNLRGEMDADDINVGEAWKGIENELPTRKTYWWLAAAAAAVALVVVTFWVSSDAPKIAEVEAPLSVEQIDPEAAKEKQELEKLYLASWTKLSDYKFEEADLEIFLNELDEINACEQDLLVRLGSASDQLDVLKKIVDQYRKKIRVVERMIRDLEKKKRNENKKLEVYG